MAGTWTRHSTRNSRLSAVEAVAGARTNLPVGDYWRPWPLPEEATFGWSRTARPRHRGKLSNSRRRTAAGRCHRGQGVLAGRVHAINARRLRRQGFAVSSCHYRVPPENPVDQYSGHDCDRRQSIRTFEPKQGSDSDHGHVAAVRHCPSDSLGWPYAFAVDLPHAIAAGYALIFGPVVSDNKGTAAHKILGRIWAATMYVVLTSFGIRSAFDGEFNWLHALSVLTFCTSTWACGPSVKAASALTNDSRGAVTSDSLARSSVSLLYRTDVSPKWPFTTSSA